MDKRVEYLLQEARRWRREGRITEAFHQSLVRQYKTRERMEEASPFQKLLLAIGGVIFLVGIFFLFTIFWEDLSDSQKLSTLLISSLPVAGWGIGLEYLKRYRLLASLLTALGLALFFFAMIYASDETSAFAGWEILTLPVAWSASVAMLVYGFWRLPALAFLSTGSIVASGVMLGVFLDFGDAAKDRLATSLLFVCGTILVASLMLLVQPRDFVRRGSAQLAGLSNAMALVPLQLIQIFEVLNVHDDVVGIACLAIFGGVLLFGGIYVRAVGLVVFSGLVLIGDAIWFGASEGGVLGTVFALIGSAIGLVMLAQSGLLKKLRARATYRVGPP